MYTSEYAAKIALSAEIKRDGSARFRVAGMPMEYSFITIFLLGENVLPADMHANWPRKIDYKVNRQRQSLSDAGRQRSAFDSHFREWAIAKNQNGI